MGQNYQIKSFLVFFNKTQFTPYWNNINFFLLILKFLPIMKYFLLSHTHTTTHTHTNKKTSWHRIQNKINLEIKSLPFCTNANAIWWLFKRNIWRKWADISKISDTNGSNSFFYICIPDFKSWLSTCFQQDSVHTNSTIIIEIFSKITRRGYY